MSRHVKISYEMAARGIFDSRVLWNKWQLPYDIRKEYMFDGSELAYLRIFIDDKFIVDGGLVGFSPRGWFDITEDEALTIRNNAFEAIGRNLKFELEMDEELYLLMQDASKPVPSRSALLRRLKTAPKIPSKRQILVDVFDRNPDVVAMILLKAKGVCQWCKSPAPFQRRTDSTPYLEVHHLHPLADGGEDTLENTVALCPNCHRRAHHG